MIRIGLLLFPGSNCERETALAVKRAGMHPVDVLWNESPERLRALDGFILVGGFSYEDRSRAGIIAALQPIMGEIKQQSRLGKPILGICNGAQILAEAGLVPGLADAAGQMALTENRRAHHGRILGTGFYNDWVTLRLSEGYQANAFTRHLDAGDRIVLPVAHAQGRFVMPDALLQQIIAQGLNLFQYCDAEGRVVDQFPVNPNGSVNNIAAVSNAAGNVLAMMPHPERTVNGDKLFTSMRAYIEAGNLIGSMPCPAQTVSLPDDVYCLPAPAHQCLVKLNITDNEAMTVQKTLQALGFPVRVHRYTHWELTGPNAGDMQAIKQAGVLYCERKEQEVHPAAINPRHAQSFLVRPKDDVLGQDMWQTLTGYYGFKTVKAVHHGIVWQFESDETDVATLIDRILSTNMIGNQYAHECYRYDTSLSG